MLFLHFRYIKSLRIKSVADDTWKILKDDPIWQTMSFFAGSRLHSRATNGKNINTIIKKSGNKTKNNNILVEGFDLSGMVSADNFVSVFP